MIKYELVGVDKLQSFHLYTDTPVRIIDIPKIRYLILDILANDYNKNELESVYDCAPYPLKPTGYKLLRFPNSIKIETK